MALGQALFLTSPMTQGSASTQTTVFVAGETGQRLLLCSLVLDLNLRLLIYEIQKLAAAGLVSLELCIKMALGQA
jgi:hypothetical protein